MNMIRSALTLAVSILSLSSSHLSADEKIYLAATETAELIAKEGQKVVVHGTTKGSGKSASGTNFVNFEGEEFVLVTFKTDLAQFKEGEPHVVYDGKRLAVEGAISVYQGKPQIKLTDSAQITILEADAVFPPKVDVADSKPATPATPGKAADPAPGTSQIETESKPKPPVDPSEYFKN